MVNRYKFTQYIIKTVFYSFGKLFLRLKIEGKENFSEIKHGGVIFFSNHIGFLDGTMIGSCIPYSYYRKIHSIRYMTYYKYIEDTWYGSSINFCGAYSVKGKGNIEETLKETIEILKEKKQEIMMFPEGKKAMEINLENVKPGLGYLAEKLNPQLIPVYLEGSTTIRFKDIIFRRKKLKVVFGKPFYYKEVASENDDHLTIAKKAMGRVMELRK